MLEAVAAPPPQSAAHAPPAASARGLEKDEASFQGLLRDALDVTAEGDTTQNMKLPPKLNDSAAEHEFKADVTRTPEGISAADAAGLSLAAEAPLSLEPGMPTEQVAAQIDPALGEMAPTLGNMAPVPVGLPVASGIYLGQPLVSQAGPSLQNVAIGDVAQSPPLSPAITAGSGVAAMIEATQTLPESPVIATGSAMAATGDAAQALPASPAITNGSAIDKMVNAAQTPSAASPATPGSAMTTPTEPDAGAATDVGFALSGQTEVLRAAATNNATQRIEASLAEEAERAPSSQVLIAQGALSKDQIKDQMQSAKALQDALANTQVAGSVQAAAAGLAVIRPQAAGSSVTPGPNAFAKAALAATGPAEAASRLAQAFNTSEAAHEMKLFMASEILGAGLPAPEIAEAGVHQASLDIHKIIGAKPSGEVQADAVPMAPPGFAPMDGVAPRTEAPLPGTNGRELPAAMPARQLAPVVVSLALGRGDEALTIALDPAELGRVEVSIGQGKEAGQVRIIAERPETLALLQRDQRELDRALNQSGLGDMARSLSFSLASDQGRQQYNGSANGKGQRASMTISGVEADRAMPNLPTLHRNPNALIDIAV